MAPPDTAITDLASYRSRAGATLLDALVIAVAAAIVLAITGTDRDYAQIVVIGATLLASVTYAPILMCRAGERNGQTLGKQAMKIRAVRDDAEPWSFGRALLREGLGKGLLGLIPLFTVVDFLFPLADPRRQSIHDKIARSFVVRADAIPDLGPGDTFVPTAWAPPRAQEDDGWAPPEPRG